MDFDLQPTLKGTLLELRPLAREDFARLYEAASDPLIWEQHPEPTRWQREVFQKYFDGGMQSGSAFAIIERSSREIIGSSRYCHLNPVESEVEIGWTFLARRFWGGTYNGELKRLMIEHALRSADRVVFVVGENNLRSQKALAKMVPASFGEIRRMSCLRLHLIETGAFHEIAARADNPQIGSRRKARVNTSRRSLKVRRRLVLDKRCRLK